MSQRPCTSAFFCNSFTLLGLQGNLISAELDATEEKMHFFFFSPYQLTEVDEDDWDISSIEEDFLLMKNDSGQKALTAQKNEANAASVVHAWGLPKKSVPKEEGNAFILLSYKS